MKPTPGLIGQKIEHMLDKSPADHSANMQRQITFQIPSFTGSLETMIMIDMVLDWGNRKAPAQPGK